MATRPIVPRGDGEGSIGTSAKKWGGVYTEEINNMPVDSLGGLSVGFITALTQSTAPDGWLSCNGAEVSRATYPDLWNYIKNTSMVLTEADWQTKNTAGDINIGWYSSGDGTTTFRLPRIVGSGELTEVKRFTTAGAGTFTAPITGIYRITLQGGGGGGGGASSITWGTRGGGGGGQGGHGVAYEKLIAGTTYSFTIGAGGSGGAVNTNGTAGGTTSITVNGNAYAATGGNYGLSNQGGGSAGSAGEFTLNNTLINRSEAGTSGYCVNASGDPAASGGLGGGIGGGIGTIAGNGASGILGGGGAGGSHLNGTNYSGGNGGDGYIEFSYNPVPQFWYVRAFGSASNQGTIDITELANMLNDKADIDEVLPLFGGGALTGSSLTWNGNDLGGASIVAKSIDTNGYIKYSNGLIMQWGMVDAGNIPATTNFTYPISITTFLYGSAVSANDYYTSYARIDSITTTSCNINTPAAAGWMRVFILAIG